jgi:hypothetical protein
VLYSKKCSVYILIFMAVSIRTARLLLLYALAKKYICLLLASIKY